MKRKLLPTKRGYEYFVFITRSRDTGWVAVNNKAKKGASNDVKQQRIVTTR